jgi:hypothetical protein
VAAARPQAAGAPTQVEQIYQRANAELSAVKAELLNKKPGVAGGSPPPARPVAKTIPPAPPAPVKGTKKPT